MSRQVRTSCRRRIPSTDLSHAAQDDNAWPEDVQCIACGTRETSLFLQGMTVGEDPCCVLEVSDRGPDSSAPRRTTAVNVLEYP
jgi:hypothetical protein